MRPLGDEKALKGMAFLAVQDLDGNCPHPGQTPDDRPGARPLFRPRKQHECGWCRGQRLEQLALAAYDLGRHSAAPKNGH